ncbi:MAG: type II toxin-antitoxin system VapC family toxin [Terriglobales bacterium]
MIVYVDASALFKLYVDESDSATARAQLAAPVQKATALIAYAELRAAFASARRLGRISPAELAQAKTRWLSDWLALSKLPLDEDRCHEAGDLAEAYGLRSFDSIHLACYAHLVRIAAPTEVTFCGFDKALLAAAARWRSHWSAQP